MVAKAAIPPRWYAGVPIARTHRPIFHRPRGKRDRQPHPPPTLAKVPLTITVSELPPSDSCSTRVSFELRYGTCGRFPPLPAEASAMITLPSAERDTLIAIPSFSRPPSAPDLDARSDPARSTRLILDQRSRRSLPSVPATASCCVTRSEKTACDREERAFISVSPVARRAFPSDISRASCRRSRTGISTSPFTCTPSDGCSLISRGSLPDAAGPASRLAPEPDRRGAGRNRSCRHSL
eukprot:scaffold4238_cov105-Isochrysis_galbana.AAC.11